MKNINKLGLAGLCLGGVVGCAEMAYDLGEPVWKTTPRILQPAFVRDLEEEQREKKTKERQNYPQQPTIIVQNPQPQVQREPILTTEIINLDTGKREMIFGSVMFHENNFYKFYNDPPQRGYLITWKRGQEITNSLIIEIKKDVDNIIVYSKGEELMRMKKH